MIKGVFIDFYGTIVHEDGEIIKKISNEIFNTGNASNIKEIDSYWWTTFKNLFENSYGDTFRLQRDLERESIKRTLSHFGSNLSVDILCKELFDEWMKPAIFEDSKKFIDNCSVPIYIVSNIDNIDIQAAVKYHNINVNKIYTSEDARSYKPRRELFEYALNDSGLNTEEVIHIGDSISSDIIGASALGIKTLWINRSGRIVPERVSSITRLTDVFEYININ